MDFKKRTPVTWFAKINYLETRFVKIAKFKSRQIFLFKIREIKVTKISDIRDL